jgi:hypothetical protein
MLNFITHSLRCCLVAGAMGLSLLIAVGLVTARPALAEDYPVDLALKMCSKHNKRHAVLAVNDFGTPMCGWNYATLLEAREETIRLCTGYVPNSMRAKVKCRVIWENGEIIDAARVALMREPYRMPVTIEAAGKKAVAGFVQFGPAPDMLTRTATVHLADGTRLCSGAARLRKLKLEFDFSAKCGGSQPLKGKAKVTGLREVGGLQRLAFDMTIGKGDDAMRIVAK